MKSSPLVIVSSLLLWACATAEPMVGPDGTEHQLISCSYGIEDCYNKAREICEGNYKIINSNTETNGYDGSISTENKLLIRCED